MKGMTRRGVRQQSLDRNTRRLASFGARRGLSRGIPPTRHSTKIRA